MPGEMTLADEVGQHHLIQDRRMLVSDLACGQEPVLKVTGDDEEAQPQGGKKRLAEAADVDDATVDVQTV